MKKLIQLNIAIIGLLVLSTSTELFAQLTLTGELRPRTEFRNGFKKLRDAGTDPAFFIEQRSRLYIDFKKDKIWLNIALQDVRIWGTVNQIYKADPSLQNVYEAWARYSFNEKYAFKVGRQAMNYDNARFMGNLDWAQQGRSHDALLFIKQDADRNCQLHLAFAYNQNVFEPSKLSGNDYLNMNNYKTMIMGWWNKKFEDGGISVLFHNDGRQVASDTSMAHRQTYAVLGNYNLGEIKLDGELYYQGGKNKSKTSVSGLLFTVHGTYTTDITPLTLGFEYLSGTSRADDKDKSFNPLYGTNHKFYGFMDY
ncbi:MAG: alginate export family protein, partial [Cyclobacteriaceae bacterium]|nr:alginate export family protein [Cyclobacteriaceae bacterium]